MKTMDQKEFARENVFGLGAENTAYAKYFIGQSYLNPLTRPESGLFLANVTFEPGCRNNWHIHHAKKGGGQMLIFSFSGSPLSGRSSHSATCTACGYQQRHVDEGSFGRLASPITRIAGQYRDLPKDDALPFEEAINLLQHL